MNESNCEELLRTWRLVASMKIHFIQVIRTKRFWKCWYIKTITSNVQLYFGIISVPLSTLKTMASLQYFCMPAECFWWCLSLLLRVFSEIRSHQVSSVKRMIVGQNRSPLRQQSSDPYSLGQPELRQVISAVHVQSFWVGFGPCSKGKSPCFVFTSKNTKTTQHKTIKMSKVWGKKHEDWRYETFS